MFTLTCVGRLAQLLVYALTPWSEGHDCIDIHVKGSFLGAFLLSMGGSYYTLTYSVLNRREFYAWLASLLLDTDIYC